MQWSGRSGRSLVVGKEVEWRRHQVDRLRGKYEQQNEGEDRQDEVDGIVEKF